MGLISRVSSRTYRKMEFLKSLLGKKIKVELVDGRTLVGNFYCTDSRANLCISNCEEYWAGGNPRVLVMALVTKHTLKKLLLYVPQKDCSEAENKDKNINDTSLDSLLVVGSKTVSEEKS